MSRIAFIKTRLALALGPIASRNAAAIAGADLKRRSGSGASARITTLSSAGSTSLTTALGGSIGCTWALTTSPRLAA